MTDRIVSDHDTVESHRVHLSQVGGTRRLQIPLPAELSLAVADVISVSFDQESCHARVDRTLEGNRALRRAVRTRQQARTGDGTDLLAEWLDTAGLGGGDPLLLDVLTEGYAYGLRQPGARVVYQPPDRPDASLADIARNLDG